MDFETSCETACERIDETGKYTPDVKSLTCGLSDLSLSFECLPDPCLLVETTRLWDTVPIECAWNTSCATVCPWNYTPEVPGLLLRGACGAATETVLHL